MTESGELKWGDQYYLETTDTWPAPDGIYWCRDAETEDYKFRLQKYRSPERHMRYFISITDKETKKTIIITAAFPYLEKNAMDRAEEWLRENKKSSSQKSQ